MANLENGNNTAGLVNVDANFDLLTTTPQVNTRFGGTVGAPNFVGSVRMFTENDSGTLSGTPILNSPWVTQLDQNLATGMMTPLFDYAFNGIVQDTSAWFYASATMVAVQSGGFLQLNSGSIGTTGTGVYMQSKRYFNLTSNAGLRFTTVLNISAAVPANQVFYTGVGIPVSATASPTDGVWFQLSSAGLIGVASYNGTLTQTGALPIVLPLTIPAVTNVHLQIRINDRNIIFLYNGSVIGSLPTPVGQGTPFLSDSLPVFSQLVNTGTVTGPIQVRVAVISLDQLDSQIGKPYQHIQASKGLMAYQGLQGGTQGSSALFTNSLAAGLGLALTNAAASVGTGLGGQFTYLPTLAASTDGILCSFQVPIGSLNQTARTLYITGVRIQSIVSIALTGGPILAVYSLAFGHTAVSMATLETGSFVTASTKAPRRITLGLEQFVVTAAVGAVSTTNCPVQMTFASPIVVNPGEFVAITAKNLGTVTTLGAITALVTFDGYYE